MIRLLLWILITMQLWGKPSCHHATVPHHPLFLKKIINQVCGKYVPIFPQRMQTWQLLPLLFSHPPQLGLPPSPPNDLIPTQKGHQLQGGSASTERITIIISDAKKPRRPCRHVQCVTALWSPHTPNQAAVWKCKGSAFLKIMLPKEQLEYFLTNPSMAMATKWQEPAKMINLVAPSHIIWVQKSHLRKMKTPDFSGENYRSLFAKGGLPRK